MWIFARVTLLFMITLLLLMHICSLTSVRMWAQTWGLSFCLQIMTKIKCLVILYLSFVSLHHLVGTNSTLPKRNQRKYVLLESRIILSVRRYHFSPFLCYWVDVWHDEWEFSQLKPNTLQWGDSLNTANVRERDIYMYLHLNILWVCNSISSWNHPSLKLCKTNFRPKPPYTTILFPDFVLIKK